jgi:hypothetical protein
MDRLKRRKLFVRSMVALVTVAAGLIGGTPAALAVIGDTAIDPRWDFIAKVQFGEVGSCTGSLIDPWWVLTAKACFADGGTPATAGAPRQPTTVTVGRFDLTNTTGGAVRGVTRIVPHPDRDVVLAELSAAVTGTTLATIGTAPRADETLATPGYGRTATGWVPDDLHAGRFSVSAVRPTTVDLAPATASASLCEGDAGGPALRNTSSSVQVVAIQHTAWQNGCLDSDETRTGAVSTRVDDLRPWIDASLPHFATGFETADPRPHWQNQAALAGVVGVGGVCCNLTAPELKLSPENGHDAARSLLYSGLDNSATRSRAYLKAFDLSQIVVGPRTVLSYWIFPQSVRSHSSVSGDNSTCVAVDLQFGNGGNLRDSGATDQRGIRVHPAQQCQHLTLDTWNQVIVPLGGVANGQSIIEVAVAYDQPLNTGGYRGYVDDLSITNIHIEPRLETGAETGQPALTWISTPDTARGVHGRTTNIEGVCCGLTGPELKSSPEKAHGGVNSLLYSGKDISATQSATYLQAFAVTHTFVTPATRLSYWIFPQSNATQPNAAGNNSTCVAVDLIFTDRFTGTEANLRDSTATDQRGNRVHPAQQCGKLTLDAWNRVTVPLGAVANGLEITQVNVGYDQPANIGGFRGYLDDIQISD